MYFILCTQWIIFIFSIIFYDLQNRLKLPHSNKTNPPQKKLRRTFSKDKRKTNYKKLLQSPQSGPFNFSLIWITVISQTYFREWLTKFNILRYQLLWRWNYCFLLKYQIKYIRNDKVRRKWDCIWSSISNVHIIQNHKRYLVS